MPMLRKLRTAKKAGTSFKMLCLKCLKLIPHDPPDDVLGSMDCTDCPHCGNHVCGARQMQLGKPCTKQLVQSPGSPL
jgi:hypothetical protein